ncbi:hypothetical protein K469DRAFT_357283 [Zopfia rhizophila CBS 207.26]|uniref:Uncharacterized protein n=1 Tax=Zopfia rhizophila CBS 207.26 TaxID=1314779 RepID=A0A6A6DEH3_9PEZI|nr:hypothetical protein K469DRAFT_357283 [Zopfia rhizophila CBS 207.26]
MEDGFGWSFLLGCSARTSKRLRVALEDGVFDFPAESFDTIPIARQRLSEFWKDDQYVHKHGGEIGKIFRYLIHGPKIFTPPYPQGNHHNEVRVDYAIYKFSIETQWSDLRKGVRSRILQWRDKEYSDVFHDIALLAREAGDAKMRTFSMELIEDHLKASVPSFKCCGAGFIQRGVCVLPRRMWRNGIDNGRPYQLRPGEMTHSPINNKIKLKRQIVLLLLPSLSSFLALTFIVQAKIWNIREMRAVHWSTIIVVFSTCVCTFSAWVTTICSRKYAHETVLV